MAKGGHNVYWFELNLRRNDNVDGFNCYEAGCSAILLLHLIAYWMLFTWSFSPLDKCFNKLFFIALVCFVGFL